MKPSVLPGGMKLVGDVGGDEDLVVFGVVEGEVHVDGALVVEAGGSVRGNVEARTVSVRGVVVGDAHAREAIRVDDGGRMVGDLHAPRVNIVKGARFRGQVHMTGDRPVEVPLIERSIEMGRPAPPPSSRGAERADPRVRRSRRKAAGAEKPTVPGSVRAVHQRKTIPGTELTSSGRRPPPPQMPKLGRTRARRRPR